MAFATYLRFLLYFHGPPVKIQFSKQIAKVRKTPYLIK